MDNFHIFRRTAARSSRAGKLLNDPVDAYRPLLATWLIEMILSLGWYKKAFCETHEYIFNAESFAVITQIAVKSTAQSSAGGYIFINGKKIQHGDMASAKMLKVHLESFRNLPITDELSLLKNICTIGRILGLNDAEMSILCFAAMLNVFPVFYAALASVCYRTSLQHFASIIALISGQSAALIMSGLEEGSPLISSGIIAVESGGVDIEQRVTLLSGFGEILCRAHKSVGALLEQFLKKAGAPSLKLEDFPHLSLDIRTVMDYLQGVSRSAEPGANILFYGAPGTGKTECVKALAAALEIDLFEISFANEDGNPIGGNDRLRAYNLCQRALRSSNNALLMFDEIEDVFPSEGGFMALFGLESASETCKSGKAWINRTLERNHTPAIWVTNDAHIDPAYLRRFDYSIRFSVPPQQVRMSIARHHLAQFEPSDAWLARIAASDQVIPAQYERAAKVARLSCNQDMARARLP